MKKLDWFRTPTWLLFILFWVTNMLDVTSSEKVASHYIYIFFLFFLMLSEVLYEDEAFKQRQLSALLASKVCDSIQICIIESIPMFMQSCKQFFSLERKYFLLRHHLGRKTKFWSDITEKRLFLYQVKERSLYAK